MIPRATDLVVGPAGTARYRGRRLPCALGKTGLVPLKREGDGGTPIGVFRIESILFRPDRTPIPRSILPSRAIRCWDGWSDDASDPDYNQPIRRPSTGSSEALRRPDPLYDLIAVLSANRDPVIPGAGSAIFLHVWRGARIPTAGCVAFPRKHLLWILETWTPQSRVVIGASPALSADGTVSPADPEPGA